VLPVGGGGGTTDLCPGRQKNPRAATATPRGKTAAVGAAADYASHLRRAASSVQFSSVRL